MEALMFALIIMANLVLASLQKDVSFVIVYLSVVSLNIGLLINALHS